MKRKHVSYIFLAAAAVVLIVVLSLHDRIQPLSFIEKIEKHENVAESHGDTIDALIFYHAADYFVYQGSVIGFQYDLINRMGKDLGLPVHISIETDPEVAFEATLTNKYDVVSFDFVRDPYISLYIDESVPHSYTYPVLITRKKSRAQDDNVKHVVHVPGRYPHHIDLSIMINQSKNWELQYEQGLSVEDLFEMMADTLIDYMVCNYNEAITMLPFYSTLALGPRVGENFPRSWVLNISNQALKDSINGWLTKYKTTKEYQKLCEKYLSAHSYVIQHSFGHRRNNISYYDRCLKNASARHHIDWRFMSSIIYQESHFSSDVLGMGGSFGIMQMMPSTCESYGITDSSSVEDQIWAGAKYISYLYRIFSDNVDSADVYYFVAASYNAGPGHVIDAKALCRKYGGDDRHWSDVSKYLALKSHREYYRDPVVKCGYYPGKHTLHYVDEVMNRYKGYLITKEEE